jgi:DNA polymerase-3 subunit epsilon
VVAHFGNEFDKLFIEASLRRHSYTPWEKHWLDTSIDVVYPARIKTRNLRHLASEHGFVNPFSHRAVFDVLTMFQIMRHYDLEEIISRSKEPVVYLQALIPFDQKEYAKGRGYRWCAEKKIWWKSFKQSDAEREKQEAGFLSQYIDKPE